MVNGYRLRSQAIGPERVTTILIERQARLGLLSQINFLTVCEQM